MSAIQTETDNLYVECLKWKLLYLYFTRKVNSRKKSLLPILHEK